MVSPTTLVCSPLLLCPYGLLGVSIQAAVFYPLGVDDISTCPVSSIVDPRSFASLDCLSPSQ